MEVAVFISEPGFVDLWVKHSHGEEGVKNRKNQTSNHIRGKKRLLSQPQLEKLTRAIENESPDGGIWTGTKVARWIETETGREKVWNQRGWDYLKKCGYSWQSPRPTHKKADDWLRQSDVALQRRIAPAIGARNI